jgi:hypothetical protein
MSEALGPNDVLPDRRKCVMSEVDRINDKLVKGRPLFQGGEKKLEVFISDVGLSHDIRQEVCREFEAAGWERVTVTTSAENGERPGLAVYTLHR